MAMKSLSRNAERKLNYARMAAEQDKESRNRDLSTALGEGQVNVEAKGKWVHTTREVVQYGGEEGDELDARVVRVKEKYMTEKEIVQPNLPTSAGRSAKRARLKASKHRLVANSSHPNGACGNVGCSRCNPRPGKVWFHKEKR